MGPQAAFPWFRLGLDRSSHLAVLDHARRVDLAAFGVRLGSLWPRRRWRLLADLTSGIRPTSSALLFATLLGLLIVRLRAGIHFLEPIREFGIGNADEAALG